MTKARDISKLLSTANGKIAGSNLDVSFENITDTGTEGTKVASGTSAQRGSTAGQFRFNTTTGFFEGFDGTTFKALDAPPTVSSIDVTEVDSQAGGNQTIVITGSNFVSGATVTFVGSTGTDFNASTVTVDSATQITAVAPKASFLNAQEPYGVKVSNLSGLSATLESQINVDSSPTWNTASGSLGTIDPSELPSSYTLTSLSATDADGDTIAYSQPSGSIPNGLILNSSTGAWSGNLNPILNTTTFNFTGRATANSKTTDRSFSIIQEGELSKYGTQYAFSFNGDTDNAGSNTDSYTIDGSVVFNSTGQTKFNANSAYFPNTGYSRFTIPNSSNIKFNTGSFTIEGWLFLVNDSSNVTLSARVFQMGANDSNGIALIHNYSDEFMFGNTHTQVVGDNPNNWLGNWRYFTVDYDGTTLRLYRDGTVVDTATSGFNSVSSNANLHFGVYPANLTNTRSNMYLSEWQITKGTAKYQGNFTPKTSAFLT